MNRTVPSPGIPRGKRQASAARKLSLIVLPTLLVLAYAFVVFLKLRLTMDLPWFQPNDDTLMFKSEGALQYRYAKIIASGNSLPEVDRDVQFPEGVRVSQELTVGMEYFAGWTYRLLKAFSFQPAFHVFLIYLIAIYSSLTVFPVYSLTRLLWGSRPAALASAFLYGAIPAPLYRTVGNYTLEDFAVPLLFSGVYFFLKAAGSRTRASIPLSCLAGICFSLSLATWHFSKFFLAIFLLTLLPSYFSLRRDQRPAAQVFALGAILGLSGLAFPVLRHQQFVLSAPMMAIYAWGMTRRSSSVLPWLGCTAGLILLSYPLQRNAVQDFNHVLSLFFYKLRFPLTKPLEPASLNQEARMMWVEDFNSPDLNWVISNLSSVAFLAAASLPLCVFAAMRRMLSPHQKAAFLLSVAFMGGSLLVKRLVVIGAPLACILVGSLSGILFKSRRIGWVLVLLLAFFETVDTRLYYYARRGWKAWLAGSSIGRSSEASFPALSTQGDYNELMRWIRNHTAPSSVFLATPGPSAEIVGYTGRRSNLHPKFESKRLRDKAADFLKTLYGSEEDLYRLCFKWQTNYVVYEPKFVLDNSRDSFRYMSDSLALSSTAAAFLFHFAPEKLRRFALAYENSGFRVYRIREEWAVRRLEKKAGRAHPVYNASLYETPIKPNGTFDDGSVPKVLMELHRTFSIFNQAFFLFMRGMHGESLSLLKERAGSPWADAMFYSRLGQMILAQRDALTPEGSRKSLADAETYLKAALQMNPQYLLPYHYLAFIAHLRGDAPQVEVFLLRGIEVDPGDPALVNNLAVVRLAQGKPREALELLERASTLDPANADIAANRDRMRGSARASDLVFIF